MVRLSSMYLERQRLVAPTSIALLVLAITATIPNVNSTNTSNSASMSKSQDVAMASQLLDAGERLLVFLAMHPERAAASGQGLGLAVALGAILSRRGARNSEGSFSERYPPSFRSRFASFESALQTILSALRNHPGRTQVAVRLLDARLWAFLPVRQPPLPSQLAPAAPRAAASEETEEGADPGDKAAAVLLELRALRPWSPPTPKQSDACLAQLLLHRRCGACAHLWAADPVDTAPASGYALTHRLLFLLVARQVGCVDVPLVNGDMAVRHLCSMMLTEAEAIATLEFPELLKDLFIEQVTLCGLAGFREFLRPSWRSTILDWQRSSGCFGNLTAQMTAIRPFLILGDTRGDSDLGGGCLAHLTDVATGVLGVQLSQLL